MIKVYMSTLFALARGSSVVPEEELVSFKDFTYVIGLAEKYAQDKK